MAIDLSPQNWDLSRDRVDRDVRPVPCLWMVLRSRIIVLQFKGTYTLIMPPYQNDITLNEAVPAEMADHLIAAGVHGIIVVGTIGNTARKRWEDALA